MEYLYKSPPYTEELYHTHIYLLEYLQAANDVNGLIFKDEVYDIKKQAAKRSYQGILMLYLQRLIKIERVIPNTMVEAPKKVCLK